MPQSWQRALYIPLKDNLCASPCGGSSYLPS